LRISLKALAPVIESALDAGLSYTFSPAGDSMRPMLYRNGCTVTLKKPSGALKKNDVALYYSKDGHLVLHRVAKVTPSGYVMLGDSTTTLEEGIEDSQIIGVVTAFTRGKKVCSVDAFTYKLYCHVWSTFPFLRKFVILFGKTSLR